MRLSDRLRTVAGLVCAGSRLADIGTDHAYLPIFLVKEHKILSAVAMDVKKGPLQAAKEHVDAAGLADYIELRLSDGLSMLREKEAGSIVIAGMGGALMLHILKQGRNKLEGVKELILQPQSEIAKVRAWLRQEGFAIEKEAMVAEDGKYYPMFRVLTKEEVCQAGLPVQAGYVVPSGGWNGGAMSFSQKEGRDRTVLFDTYGRLLLEAKDAVLGSYLQAQEKQYAQVAETLQHNNIPKERSMQVRQKLQLVRQARYMMEGKYE